METTIKRDHGKSGAGYRAFSFDKSRPGNIGPMGKIVGDDFRFKKVHKIKTILLDKNLFPTIQSVESNAEDQGFGYISITFTDSLKRAHIHWYELTVKILAPMVISYMNNLEKDSVDLESFYRRVFVKHEDPVNLLYHFYKDQE